MFIFTPIFVDGQIIAFAGTVAHHLDLGGGNPGMTPDAVDVHAEGIIIPPSRYTYDRDWNGGPLERLVAANVRVPSQTIGDFYAQFAANAIGTARMAGAQRALWRAERARGHERADELLGAPLPGRAARHPGRHLSRRGRRRR